jgi:alpha-mannosidase
MCNCNSDKPASKAPQGLTRREALKLGGKLVIGAVGATTLGQLGVTVVNAQGEIRRIYIAPDDHTDYLWAGTEEEYRIAIPAMLDFYLDLADETAGLPSEYQSRWNTDGNFWMWLYERERTPEQFNRLMERVRSGHISMPLNTLVLLLGATPAEAVLRGMYYSGKLERRYNLRFHMAHMVENQTHPYGLTSLWAGAGAKYTWKGICGCNVPRSLADREPGREMYWAVGPDGSRLLMKWYSLMPDSTDYFSHGIGSYAEAYDPRRAIEYADSDAFKERNPYSVVGLFGKGWDDLETYTDEFVVVAQEYTDEVLKIIVSNQMDFFQDFEATHGGEIPSVAVSYGNEWEIYTASLAEVTASVKRSLEKLRAAEALATLISQHDPAFMPPYSAAAQDVWMHMGMYWEHNWGPADREDLPDATRIAFQRRVAGEIANFVDRLHADATRRFADLVTRASANPAFYVFNPLSWGRTDYVDMAYTGDEAVTIVDVSAGTVVPHQFITGADGVRYLRVLATEVPSLGYKVFEIFPGASDPMDNAATITDNFLENDFYRIVVSSRGALDSLVAKQLGEREFVGDWDGEGFNDLGAGEGVVTLENVGPVTVTLRVEADTPMKHITRITLVRDLDRIEIENILLENFDDMTDWKFSLNLDAPDVIHEEVGAVIRAKLETEGGQYTATNGRYDWLTFNHFLTVNGADGAGLTFSNWDASFFKLGKSTFDELDTTTPQISVLIGGHEAGEPGSVAFMNQDGDSEFRQRLALRAHTETNAVAAMRFALEHQNPLVAGMVSGANGVLPSSSYSFLYITEPDVLLWALKPGEDDPTHSLLARVWNVANEPRDFSILLPDTIQSGEVVSHIETPLGAAGIDQGTLADRAEPQQFKSYLLHF